MTNAIPTNSFPPGNYQDYANFGDLNNNGRIDSRREANLAIGRCFQETDAAIMNYNQARVDIANPTSSYHPRNTSPDGSNSTLTETEHQCFDFARYLEFSIDENQEQVPASWFPRLSIPIYQNNEALSLNSFLAFADRYGVGESRNNQRLDSQWEATQAIALCYDTYSGNEADRLCGEMYDFFRALATRGQATAARPQQPHDNNNQSLLTQATATIQDPLATAEELAEASRQLLSLSSQEGFEPTTIRPLMHQLENLTLSFRNSNIDEQIDNLVSLLTCGDQDLQLAAALSLVRINDDRALVAVPILRSGLSSLNPNVRALVLFGLFDAPLNSRVADRLFSELRPALENINGGFGEDRYGDPVSAVSFYQLITRQGLPLDVFLASQLLGRDRRNTQQINREWLLGNRRYQSYFMTREGSEGCYAPFVQLDSQISYVLSTDTLPGLSGAESEALHNILQVLIASGEQRAGRHLRQLRERIHPHYPTILNEFDEAICAIENGSLNCPQAVSPAGPRPFIDVEPITPEEFQAMRSRRFRRSGLVPLGVIQEPVGIDEAGNSLLR